MSCTQQREADAVLHLARRAAPEARVIEAERAVARRFGAVQAVRDVSLRAPDGRITGLLGPNGAGKSTTLRILYTVLQPDCGRRAHRWHERRAARRSKRGDASACCRTPPASISISRRARTSCTSARCTGSPRAEREARADELIELLEMRDFADRAREEALAGPADEDGARARAGAPAAQRAARRAHQRARRDGRAQPARAARALRDEGHCVLFSSHVMQEVAALCDDVVVIAHGERRRAAARPTRSARAPGRASSKKRSCSSSAPARGCE